MIPVSKNLACYKVQLTNPAVFGEISPQAWIDFKLEDEIICFKQCFTHKLVSEVSD